MSNQFNLSLEEIQRGYEDRDSIHRFLFKDKPVQGLWLSVDKALSESLANHPNLPKAIVRLMGELLLVASIFRHYLKDNGMVSLGIHSPGSKVSLLLVHATNTGVRCIPVYDKEAIVNLADDTQLEDVIDANARLILRTQGGNNATPYESIIEVNLNSIQDSILDFYKQSVQLPVFLRLRSEINQFDQVHANALFMQFIPDDSGTEADFEDQVQLANTVTDAELLGLSAFDLLYRLFNQEEVIVTKERNLQFECTCSRDKMLGAIASLGEAEVIETFKDLAAQGKDEVELVCECCYMSYSFTQDQVMEAIAEHVQDDFVTQKV